MPSSAKNVCMYARQPCSRCVVFRKDLPTCTILSSAPRRTVAAAAAGHAVQEQRSEDALTMPTPSSSARGAATPYMLRQPPTASMNQKPEAYPARMPATMRASLREIKVPRTEGGLVSAM